MRHEYKRRRVLIADALGCSFRDVDKEIVRMYVEESMSSPEIAERLSGVAGVVITPRSIQRIVKKYDYSRSTGDAFRLAVSKNRVNWAYKDPLMKARRSKLAKAKRYQVLKRDGFACVLCGSTAEMGLLEVDHKVAVVNGGTNNLENLRTLCHDCNQGKRIVEKER